MANSTKEAACCGIACGISILAQIACAVYMGCCNVRIDIAKKNAALKKEKENKNKTINSKC